MVLVYHDPQDNRPTSFLNPRAPPYTPTHTPVNGVPASSMLLVNAEWVHCQNQLCSIMPEARVLAAIGDLIAGVKDEDGNLRVYQVPEMKEIFYVYAQGARRSFDLSKHLGPVVVNRVFAHNLLQRYNVEDRSDRRLFHLEELENLTHYFDGLIRRILFAEQYGVFTINHVRPAMQSQNNEGNATLSSDAQFSIVRTVPFMGLRIDAVEREVKHCLVEMHRSLVIAPQQSAKHHRRTCAPKIPIVFEHAIAADHINDALADTCSTEPDTASEILLSIERDNEP
ncbi:uncharacterized protein F4822DRAFT_426412 [Hypoxylon trugodes]|uniref:uncharacterized protein n=1 Tax=Hypoxylon trugodes TaxID=326681 RepID=UPI0021A0A760|nr:uncharacterized protein F4822DRAFT_426412 [Hypoxylon trugodes]KAI1390565.1 hypothetical protein F4822DRAFT_426412 [Hypoxylon trugodes]